MDRKLVINLCVLVVLICIAFLVGTGIEAPQVSEEKLEIMDEYEIEEYQQKALDTRRMFTLGPLVLCIVIYAAILFIIYVLPNIVHRATHQIYDSGEMIEADPLHDARSLFAQGDYEGAISSFRTVAEENTGDRYPWVEIAKIQSVNQEDPDAAIATLKEALSSYDWMEKDAAFMMFRVAELYEKDKEDLETTKDILNQIAEMFPETRHSANATHRLRELGAL